MPNQIPPAWSIAGPLVSTMIRSRPGAMPLGITPRIFTWKLVGVVPWVTLKPIAFCPGVSEPGVTVSAH